MNMAWEANFGLCDNSERDLQRIEVLTEALPGGATTVSAATVLA
jgi:hypothetical protein